MDKNKVYTIIKAWFDGIIPSKYDDGLKRFLSDDKENKDDVLRQVWLETESTADESTMEDLKNVHHSAGINNFHYTHQVFRILKYAAAIVIPIIAVWATWSYASYYFYNQTQMVEVYSSFGHIKDITLSDGTHVKLNSGSTLVYPKEFNNRERDVIMYGEAFFSVSKDKSHPFIVHSGDLRIRVLGTQFNVKAYPDANEIITTLVNGKVKVYSTLGKSDSAILYPGMQAVYNRIDGKMVVANVDTMETKAWTNGELNINGENLNTIISLLERHYNVSITVAPGVDLNRKYSMDFKSYENLNSVLRILAEISGNNACIEKKGVGKNI
jgi:ferric-dicitrate binding protein FerR (iron transport regulator)